MNKRVALLLCGTAALMTLSSAAQATTPAAPDATTALDAQSYADLLDPIPDAVALVKADDAQRARQRPARLQLAQHHHHHHHHHAYYGDDEGAGIVGGIIGGMLAAPAYAPRHCYWTRGEAYWNGRHWVRPRVRVCD